MTLKSGGARIVVVWGNDRHEIVLTRRNWSGVKRGGKLKIRSRGYSEEGPQWEYWSFAGSSGALYRRRRSRHKKRPAGVTPPTSR